MSAWLQMTRSLRMQAISSQPMNYRLRCWMLTQTVIKTLIWDWRITSMNSLLTTILLVVLSRSAVLAT